MKIDGFQSKNHFSKTGFEGILRNKKNSSLKKIWVQIIMSTDQGTTQMFDLRKKEYGYGEFL